MADLCVLADVRAWLSKAVADTDDDAELTRLCAAVSEDIRQRTGQDITQATYTLTFDGHGNSMLSLPHSPVTAVTSVTIDGAVVSPSTGWGINGWVIDTRNNAIRLRGSVFNAGIQNVVIVFTAGWATVPKDVNDLAIRTVAHRYAQKRWIGQNQRSVDSDVTTFDTSPWPKEASSILSAYTRTAVG